MFLLKLLQGITVDLKVYGRPIFRIGGTQIFVDPRYPAAVYLEDGVFQQKTKRWHLWNEHLAGAIQLG